MYYKRRASAVEKVYTFKLSTDNVYIEDYGGGVTNTVNVTSSVTPNGDWVDWVIWDMPSWLHMEGDGTSQFYFICDSTSFEGRTATVNLKQDKSGLMVSLTVTQYGKYCDVQLISNVAYATGYFGQEFYGPLDILDGTGYGGSINYYWLHPSADMGHSNTRYNLNVSPSNAADVSARAAGDLLWLNIENITDSCTVNVNFY